MLLGSPFLFSQYELYSVHQLLGGANVWPHCMPHPVCVAAYLSARVLAMSSSLATQVNRRKLIRYIHVCVTLSSNPIQQSHQVWDKDLVTDDDVIGRASWCFNPKDVSKE